MEWIITAKPTGKDGYQALEAFSDLGVVHWHRSKLSANIKEGDIVYIYVGRPYGKIMIKTKCTNSKSYSSKAEREKELKYYNDIKSFPFSQTDEHFELTKIEIIDSDLLSLRILQDKKLVKGNIQGSYSSQNHSELFKYIESVFMTESKTIEEYVDNLPEEINPSAPIVEGAKKLITVNAYERDPKARKACRDYYIKRYGKLVCQVCGFDFGDAYGLEYSNLIHIHHIVPLSEIGKNYVVNPIKDLVPVCPNCHMILHYGKGITIEELKKRI